MTDPMIRADLHRMLDTLDAAGEFGAACFVSMAIDALGGPRTSIGADEGLIDAARPPVATPPSTGDTDAQRARRRAPPSNGNAAASA